MSEPASTRLHGLRIALVTALVYAVVGAAALLLAGPPGYASPLYPSAGIALAAVIACGRMALPGVFLGALAVNAGLGVLKGHSSWAVMSLPLLIATGATLQAWAASLLLHRTVGTHPALNSPRDIAMAGLLAGLLASCISASVGTLALVATGTLPGAAAVTTWLTWWGGDTLGVLIAAPMALTVIGQPSADWRPRRLTLGLPLLLGLSLVALALSETGRLEQARQRVSFEREVDRLSAEAQSRLRLAEFALQALEGAARTGGGLDKAGLAHVARWWLAQPIHLQAAGYSVRVPLENLAAFEAAARLQGPSGFRVFDRDQGQARAELGEVVAVRHIEPELGNAAAIGVNAMSIPAAREAITRSRRSGDAVATAGFRLTQAAREETGVVIYQALYDGQPVGEAARIAQFRGVVFVTLSPANALADLQSQGPVPLRWCLVDAAPQGERPRLAGPAGCELQNRASLTFSDSRPLKLAGRSYEFRVWVDSSLLFAAKDETTWLLSLSGLVAAALLGALLLTITGSNRRTELAVHAGTEELRAQVTERQQAETALRESSERMRSILDAVPLGVLFMDPQGYVIECNRRFCEMTHLDADRLLGRSIVELVHPGDVSLIKHLRRSLLKETNADLDATIRLLVGPDRQSTVRASGNGLRDATGRVVRMVVVIEDITEHLRLEASEKALQRAEAANRAKSEFLSRMSHELRTPLNAMIGFAQLLALDREPTLVAHQKDWTQQIQRAGWHLLEMINETLDLARIEAGTVQLKLDPVDVAPLLAACTDLVANAAVQHGVNLDNPLGDQDTTVIGDGTRLKQVLTNLLSNAIKYNREGGSVTVCTRRLAEGRIEIEVKDTGLGMSEQQLASLFQPYNRLGRERTNIEGTGIGLVIARRLTELMGGTLDVSSQQNHGSSFRLTLPEAPQAEHPVARFTATSPAPYQQRWVHYVEDNETNVEVMRGVLAQRAQIKMTTSLLGLDGLGAIRNDRPDLVLLDMQLPDISGLELLRHLKHDSELAEIPVIVVSADATVTHMQEALTLGALHYVTKPLDVSAFLSLVDSALEAADTRWGM